MDNVTLLLPANAEQRSLILDTNLLVLLITAAAGLSTHSFKRVRAFEKQDIELLYWLISRFKTTLITAYTLAEVSNLGNELTGWKREKWFKSLATLAMQSDEAHVSTKVVGQSRLIVAYGVCDAALDVLTADHVLLTAEFRLSGQISGRNRTALTSITSAPFGCRALLNDLRRPPALILTSSPVRSVTC